MHMVRDNFELFGFSLADNLMLQFGAGQEIELEHVTMRDLALCFQALSRNVCYQRTCKTNRKDVHPSNGVLDFDLTCIYYRFSKQTFENGPPARSHFDAHLVGCSLTNDRLAASKQSNTSLCRLCGVQKETLQHLVEDCSGTYE